ncbi:hypothetical protein [Sulfurimonas sp. HSL-1716]|uniref:hypothetical protein n=1 Tax=Hydrocurvibacter sulfurireducens TaxID=3131937 RepID=UPI0031F81494
MSTIPFIKKYIIKIKKGSLIVYTIVHTIHLYAIFIYGGFLFVDNLFLSKMPLNLPAEEAKKAKEAIMVHVRKVVPYALMVAVASGLYMFSQIFGEIGSDGLSRFQIMLAIKAFFGLWLGLRGINQKFFGINPWVFKSHIFPLSLVIIMIFLSQFMYL